LALLLHIDTALEHAGVYLSNNHQILAAEKNTEQKNHASFLQPTIQKILQQQKLSIQSIDAVVVVNGPGSYTGLRVGLASAKGICYALQKPLITLNTLHLMANAMHQNITQFLPENNEQKPVLYCPMIDARRMEVYTALYNQQMQEIIQPTAMILDEHSFYNNLKEHIIVFFGNGHHKLKQINHHSNAVYVNFHYLPESIVALAEEAFTTNNFANLAYSEPYYLKDFYTPTKGKI
jgi:tRNA threonylcarbamoyladenosine biosynthesis protein TsaB